MINDDVAHQALLGEVRRILDEPDVRMTDNFIELGGNSIMAVRLVKILEDEHGIKIDVTQLMGAPLENVPIRNIEN